MRKAVVKMDSQVHMSFLSDDFKEQYKAMIQDRLNRLK
jgi:hypothetical protein